MGPLQPEAITMNELLTLLANNPDAPITLLLLVWIITQINNIKARVDGMQHDVDHLLRAIVLTKFAKDESTNNRHKIESNKSGVRQEEQT